MILIYKYWVIVFVPFIYFGTYMTLVTLKGDVTYYPDTPIQATCGCDAPNGGESNGEKGPAKTAQERLMEEVNERNKKYLESISYDDSDRKNLEYDSAASEYYESHPHHYKQAEIVAKPAPAPNIVKRMMRQLEFVIAEGSEMFFTQESLFQRLCMISGLTSDEDSYAEVDEPPLMETYTENRTRSCIQWAFSSEMVRCTRWKERGSTLAQWS